MIMKECTATEYYQKTRVPHSVIKRDSGKRYYNESVTLCGKVLGEKHQQITRGKVVSETYYVT